MISGMGRDALLNLLRIVSLFMIVLLYSGSMEEGYGLAKDLISIHYDSIL